MMITYKGIVVKNLAMRNLWDEKNSGDCYLCKRGHIFITKPVDTIEIFSDLTCETPDRDENPTYKVYRPFDKDRNCKVGILTDCILSNMRRKGRYKEAWGIKY